MYSSCSEKVVEEIKPKLKLTPAEKIEKYLQKIERAVNKEKGENCYCGESDRGLFFCSRKKDHTGLHIAIADKIVRIW